MKNLKETFFDSQELCEYLTYRLLWSNNLKNEKEKIWDEINEILKEACNIVAFAKLEWIESHNAELPDWEIVFFKDKEV